MNWEMKNLLCDLEIVKQKIDDVILSHGLMKNILHTNLITY